MIKFAFFGTPYVARDTLAILKEHGLVPTVVVTGADQAQGRGLEVKANPTKEWAVAEGVPVRTPEVFDAAEIETIAGYGSEVAIVVAYGKILPESLISAFPKGVLNIHYSLLPKYRGASPVEAALLHGDVVTGVAIQRMVRELDAGDIVALKEVPIEATETTHELRGRLIVLGAELLGEVLPKYLAGEIVPTTQDHTQATRARKIAKEDGRLELSGDAQENWNKYRAYFEWPGTYFFIHKHDKEMRVKIAKAKFENGVFIPLRVVPEGKREMNYEDFLRG
jgi:methionyl-tRNA formyltransferase